MHSSHSFDSHLVKERDRDKKRRADASLRSSKDAGRDIRPGNNKLLGYFVPCGSVSVLSLVAGRPSPTTFDSWRLSSE